MVSAEGATSKLGDIFGAELRKGDGEESGPFPDDDEAAGGSKRKRDDIEPVLEAQGAGPRPPRRARRRAMP